MNDSGPALDVYLNKKIGDKTGLQFRGFNSVFLPNGNNYIDLRQKADAGGNNRAPLVQEAAASGTNNTDLGLRTLYTGDGNDTVDSSIAGLRINFGNGNDTLVEAGAGSIVAAGQGHDVFRVQNQILLTGVKHTDRIMVGDQELTGGIQYAGSESPWALGKDGERYDRPGGRR